MTNICEPVIKIVKSDKPKWLTGLSQKGKEARRSSPNCGLVDQSLPGREQVSNPTYSLRWNLETPYISHRESEPQGEPMGMREWDGTRSECRSVMGWIGIESYRQHHPTRKRADVCLVLYHEEAKGNMNRDS
jgi:hypothetical protein